MAKKSKKQEQEIDPWDGMEEWEAQGFDSKEEYDDFMAKSAEDPLYGWGNCLSMKELRAMLKQEKNRPSGQDAKYPDHLLLDEKTGMYYTDFFRDFRTHLVLGHILAVECMECENLDWERVTGGFNPYIISRFQNMCEYPLCHEKNKIVEKAGEGPYPGETFVDFFDWRLDRLKWFVDKMPTTPYLPEEGNTDPQLTLKLQEIGLSLKGKKGWAITGRVQWDMLATEYDDIEAAPLDNNDPYHTQAKLIPWDKYACLHNFLIINHQLGVEVVRKLVTQFRYEWRRIAAFHEFGLAELSKTRKEDFRYFLFDGMDYYLDEWSKNTEEQPETPQPIEQPKLTFEDVFSMRYRRTPEYEMLLHFLDVERKEASNGDWARYALALSSAKIFVHSPKTFKGWLPRFCELFGRSVPYQDPNKLNRTQCRKDISVYLPDW